MSSKPYRVGQWLPSDPKVLDECLDNLIKKVLADPISQGKLQAIEAQHPPAENKQSAEKATIKLSAPPSSVEYRLHEPVEKLKEAILNDPEINIFFHQMFWQQYSVPDSSEGVKIPSWHLMIVLIDYIMTTAPEFNETGLGCFPIHVILKSPMKTTAGFAAFLNDKVNKLFKNILNYWAHTWLNTPASCSVLTMKSPGGFVDDYECDPKLPHYGFKSWDDFFTRKFRPGRRPVASPDNNDIVANACESVPYKLAYGVKHRDFLWIKNQRYSMDFILNMSAEAKKFYGGTVYQAFLRATSYHRWHSPVSGIIHKTELVDGSYYSQTHNIQDDPASPNMTHCYLAHVAARGIIYIKADSDSIGLMCFVSIGISEVSSNEITVKEGQRVEKGDELGMFHFGGSTHLLIFRPEVDIQFDLGQESGLHSTNINVNAKIAEVKKPKK
ncbi:Decarboxylase iboD [Acropora cervicornis]|uniref:Decarboxylase iboD n=1 Tax=Acropora cervicornis TaxID=6130 RepID=A0AAD9VDA4_ACRCE|nr:Decarboxylase iboD [Acropora cervicornis]